MKRLSEREAQVLGKWRRANVFDQQAASRLQRALRAYGRAIALDKPHFAPHALSSALYAGRRPQVTADILAEANMTAQTDRTRRAFVMEEAVAILARTPATLDALLRGLPGGWIVAHEGGDTWSPFDVIGHLIHGERTDWMRRVKIILEHGETRAFDKFDRFAQFGVSEGRTLASLLDEFATLRRENLRELEMLRLTDADFDRRGRHPELGVVTLRQLLATWVAHDLDHVVQISRVLARQYSDEVGPWRAYLRIISGTQG